MSALEGVPTGIVVESSHPSTAPRPRGLTFVKAGDCITATTEIGRPEKFMVLRHCQRDDRRLHCVPCDQPLANVGQAEMHCAEGTAHQIVSYCKKHKCFEAVSTATAQQLAQMTVLPTASSATVTP